MTTNDVTNAYVTEDNNSADLNGSCLTFVFIDCTWYQVHKIATDPRLSSKFDFLWSLTIMMCCSLCTVVQNNRPPYVLNNFSSCVHYQ